MYLSAWPRSLNRDPLSRSQARGMTSLTQEPLLSSRVTPDSPWKLELHTAARSLPYGQRPAEDVLHHRRDEAIVRA